MSKKIIGISFVAVWITIFTIEILGLSGATGRGRPDMTQSVRTNLTTLALAESSEGNIHDELKYNAAFRRHDVRFYRCAEGSPDLFQFIHASLPLYKLHETFRL